MIELLRAAAGRDPRQPAVITTRTATYPDLVTEATAVARGLNARGIERFALIAHDAIDAITVLAGASMVGAEPCLYAPDSTPEAITSLTERFDHSVVITARDDLTGPTQISLADLREAAEPAPHAPEPSRRPLMVLTTGTTGLPRGARHDWARLLRAATRAEPQPDQRWLLAYGVHQFAGLQVLIHVLASGATLVAPPSNQPRAALATIQEHAVDHVSATPTFWRFLLAELRAAGGTLDLSQITLGGEAVPDRLLEDLRVAFPGTPISQIYAATEFGQTGSVRDGRFGLPTSVLERGDDADVALKVVDGELWVRSRIGMLGYHGEESVDPDAWRSTGDLVDIEGDRIVFRGRAAEIINVGGVKVAPLPVEARIGAVPGVAMARVYGRPSAMTGSIVAVDVVADPGVDEDDLYDAIRDACADLPAAHQPRSIKFVEAISTQGNKLVRRMTDT